MFEDEWLIAVNKPQGIYSETILCSVHNLLNADQGLIVTQVVLVITKSHKVAAKLVKAFTRHMVRMTYLALCVGSVPKGENLIIKSGHGRSRHGAWRVYAFSDVGRTLPGGSSVKDMETLFEVMSVNEKGCFQEFSGSEKHAENIIVVEKKFDVATCSEKAEVLIRAYSRSGRTNQIRLHCQYLGIPIRGDVKYEGAHEWKEIIYDGHELHAESLSFEHPVTGQSVLIQASLPCGLARL